MFGLNLRMSNDKMMIVVLLLVLFGYFAVRYFSQWKQALVGLTHKVGAMASEVTKPQFVLYYANWCGYSKQFLPEWNKFVEYAKANLSKVDVKEIVCEGDGEKVCSDHQVRGFPTVRLYKGSQMQEYDGERNAQALIDYVNKHC